jgi:hypothetical protein
MSRYRQMIINEFRANLRAGHTVAQAADLATYEIDSDADLRCVADAEALDAALAWWNCEADWKDHA